MPKSTTGSTAAKLRLAADLKSFPVVTDENNPFVSSKSNIVSCGSSFVTLLFVMIVCNGLGVCGGNIVVVVFFWVVWNLGGVGEWVGELTRRMNERIILLERPFVVMAINIFTVFGLVGVIG